MSLRASSRLSSGLAPQKRSALRRSLGRSSIQAPLWRTSGLRLPLSRSSSRRVSVTPPIIRSQLQSRDSPRVKPLDRSGRSALIANPRRLARPPDRLGGSSTPMPALRSWCVAVRTKTNASAGVSCIVSGVALSSPRSIGGNTVRARPRPSSSTSPAWSTLISPSWSVSAPEAQAAAAGSLRLGSASACKPNFRSQSSSPSFGVFSSRQVRAAAKPPAIPSRQCRLAAVRRSASSLPTSTTPVSEARASCHRVSRGSRPSVVGSNPLRSSASTKSSSKVATLRRPLRGRQQATGLAARIASGRSLVVRLLRRPSGSRQGRAQVATRGSVAARSSSRRRSSSRFNKGTQRARWG